MWNSNYYVLLKVSFYHDYYFSNEIITRAPLTWTLEILLSHLGSCQTFNMMLSHPPPRLCDLCLLCYLVGHLCDMCDRRDFAFVEFLGSRHFTFTMHFFINSLHYYLLFFHVAYFVKSSIGSEVFGHHLYQPAIREARLKFLSSDSDFMVFSSDHTV